MFYNCSAWKKEKDAEVRQVLKFIYGLKPESGFALELNKAASMAKQKSRLEDEYMYFSDILEDEKEEAREIGLAEGRAEGEIKRAMEAARNLLVMNILTHEQIAAAQRLSVEEVDRIAEEIKSETISLQ